LIHDRRKLKWQPAFFMPEHVKLLKQIPKEDARQKKPELDVQAFQEIGIIVMESLDYTLPIKLTIWRDGYIKNYIGTVDKVDELMTYILFKIDGENRKIFIVSITAAERVYRN
jgi:hypothetical protein